MTDKLVIALLFIVIIILALWLRSLSKQVNTLFDAYNTLSEILEQQLNNTKKIIAATQSYSKDTHSLIQSVISMLNDDETKKE